jgi:hypothetical protein
MNHPTIQNKQRGVDHPFVVPRSLQSSADKENEAVDAAASAMEFDAVSRRLPRTKTEGVVDAPRKKKRPGPQRLWNRALPGAK